MLGEGGYCLVDTPEQADVVILNTCMVRARAEEKATGRLAHLAAPKAGGRPMLGVGGCMAQGYADKPFHAFPQADFIFGTRNLAQVPALIAQAQAGERTASIPAPGRDGETLPVHRRNSFQAYVAVSEGCSLRCTYCVVPHVRGPLRSRPPEEIAEELRRLAHGGCQEVTLLGQNVDAYGTDRSGTLDFAQLLRLAAATGIPRIRFTSSHPAYITKRVLQAMADEPAVCEHLHLAVQSGSDAVLRRMGRGHTRAQLEQLINLARETVPGINLTTDVIVGFPGETESDFRRTLTLLEWARFGTVYAARYSPRPHTPAAKRPDSVPEEIKKERLQRVLELSRHTALALHTSQIGRNLEVLVEGRLADKGLCHGKTRDFRTVLFPGDVDALRGKLVTVHINEGLAGGMRGCVVQGRS